jgi:hypothetical protein
MSRAKSYHTKGKKVKSFQIRWAEPLGHSECPYAYRWVLLTPWFNIRLHHFLRSDDKRYFHDHAWDFWTFILKGYYYDVSPTPLHHRKKVAGNFFDKEKNIWCTKKLRKQFNIYKVNAEHRHYVDVPYKGCWTLVFNLPKRRNWGFWVKDKFKRPLSYFHKYGHPPCSEQ